MRLAVLLALALAAAALHARAADVIAVPGLGFTDSSGEPAEQSAAHAARLSRFAETLRTELAASGRVQVVVPDCPGCSPLNTSFETMTSATEAAGAQRMLVGTIHKISTLIGSVRVTLIDLEADQVVCTRILSYRGDTDEAWMRAAQFTAGDVLAHCLP
jgi:Protein of unknown function (DUF2380)